MAKEHAEKFRIIIIDIKSKKVNKTIRDIVLLKLQKNKYSKTIYQKT